MPIPIITPALRDIPLPTDIMARIAAAQQQVQQAQMQPLLQQAELAARRAQTQAAQQAAAQQAALAPFHQALLSAQIAGIPSQIALRGAQAKMAQAHAKNLLAKSQDPYAGQILPGPAGQAQGIQLLIDKYGINNPIVQRALAISDAAIEQQKARATFMTSNVGLKNLPQIRKTQLITNWQLFNQQRQTQGLNAINFDDWLIGPGANQMSERERKLLTTPEDTINHTPMSTVGAEPPEQQGQPHPEGAAPVFHQVSLSQPKDQTLSKDQATTNLEDFASEAKQTQLKIAKESSDPQIFRKWVNFNNIVKTIGDVNPAVFERYTGPEGLGRMGRDRALELAGTPVPEFEAYNNFTQITVPTIADTIRQAYGTSIDPKIFNILKRMSNPITWKNSPALAVSEWNTLNSLMHERRQVLSRYVGLSTAQQEQLAPIVPPKEEPKREIAQKSVEDLVKQFRGQ